MTTPQGPTERGKKKFNVARTIHVSNSHTKFCWISSNGLAQGTDRQKNGPWIFQQDKGKPWPGDQDEFNYFLASSNFYHLLITFENSLDPDQNQQNDLDPNSLTTFVPERFFEWKKSAGDNKITKKYAACKDINIKQS